MESISRQHRLLFRIIVPVLSVIVFMTVTELIVRALSIDVYFQNRFFVLNRALDYPEIFDKDHRLFWKLRQNRTEISRFFEGRSYHTNNLGLRGPDIGAKTRPRLLMLGNSCTFGWGVNDDQTFSAQLQRLLGNEYEIINGGVPGYSSYQGRLFFEDDLIKLQPDVVFIMFSWNDLWAAANGIPDKEQKFPPQAIIDVQNCLSRLHTYRLLKKLLLTPIEQNPDSLFDRQNIVYRVSIPDYAANLRDICRFARDHTYRPILLTSPVASLETYYPVGVKSGLHRYHDAYNDAVRQVADEDHVELIDLAAAFDTRDDLFDNAIKDPMHFNARGHAFAAEVIAGYLEDSL